MTGLQHYRTIKTAEDMAEKLGMTLAPSKYGQAEGMVALLPAGKDYDADHKLPIYSRDAELMAGTYEDLIKFMQGWEKAYQYLRMLKVTTDEKILRKEDLYKQEAILRMMKNDNKG